MNSDNLILRETTFPPLVNKNDFLNSAEFDANFINIYEDLVSLCSTTGVIEFDEGTTYDDSINQFASYNGRLYRWIDPAPGAGVTPGTEGASEYWTEIFPTDLAHRKNSDEFLAEGTADEVSAAEIRAFIDAGLTTTTDLSITEKTGTSFKLNSSTGADVTIPAATSSEAGLLTAGDKVKLQRLTGTNTGDQTLESLGAEAVANKTTDFSTLNDELYPSVQATETRIGERIDELKGSPPAELDTLEKMASAIANPTRMTTLGKNSTGSTLRKGTVVYINGASGGVPTFAKAKADSEATSSRTLGVILADISNLGEGYAVTLGDVDSLDTRTTAANPFTSDTLAVGDQLYLSPTTAGYVTNVKPTAPNHIVYIGKVLNTGTHDGEILYQIQNGYELEELHNVKNGATDGQYLKYIASSGLWEPTTLSTGGVCGISNSSGVYTYYANLTLAMAAATSGQTIEIFADINETGSVEITLKDGVTINGNGHTYTLNNSGTIHALKAANSVNTSCNIINLNVVRTGSTANLFDNSCLILGISGTGTINCNGSTFKNLGSGSAILFSTNSTHEINFAVAIAKTTYGSFGIFTSAGAKLNHSLAYSSLGGVGIRCHNGGEVQNCIGISDSGYGIFGGEGNISNSTGISTSGVGLNAGKISANSVGKSITGNGIEANSSGVFNCTGVSVSSRGISSNNSNLYSCIGLSTSSAGIFLSGVCKNYNITAKSVLSYALWVSSTNTPIYGGVIICEWNNSAGYGIRGNGGFICDLISNCTFNLSNSSAPYLFNDGIAQSIEMRGNTYKGGAAFNVNLTQSITNTEDSQGNIYL